MVCPVSPDSVTAGADCDRLAPVTLGRVREMWTEDAFRVIHRSVVGLLPPNQPPAQCHASGPVRNAVPGRPRHVRTGPDS